MVQWSPDPRLGLLGARHSAFIIINKCLDLGPDSDALTLGEWQLTSCTVPLTSMELPLELVLRTLNST